MQLRAWVRFGLLVVVALLTCAAALPPLILVPANKPGAATYFQHGQAFAALERESTSVLLAASTCKQFGKSYLRIWVMYFSRMDHPVLLNPVYTFSAKVVTNQGYDLLDPALPYQMLAEAENAKARAIIATAIGGALQSIGASLSARPTTIKSISSSSTTNRGRPDTYSFGSQTSTVNDREEKVAARFDAIADQAGQQLAAIRTAHEMFEASFNAGVLRKHTVFPQSGVTGFIYVPLPAHEVIGLRGGIPHLGSRRWEDGDISYVPRFSLPGMVDTLTFYPSFGE